MITQKADMPSPFDCHLKYYNDVIKAIDSKDINKIITASNASLIKSYDARGLLMKIMKMLKLNIIV